MVELDAGELGAVGLRRLDASLGDHLRRSEERGRGEEGTTTKSRFLGHGKARDGIGRGSEEATPAKGGLRGPRDDASSCQSPTSVLEHDLPVQAFCVRLFGSRIGLE